MWQRHSPETIASVARFAAEGMTQAEAAIELGVTKNVIVGLANRNGVKFDRLADVERPPPEKRQKPRPFKATPHMKCEEMPERSLDAPDDQSEAITFADLKSDSCRYPYGIIAENYMFCGKKQFEDLPYCPRHCARCYQPRK